MTKRFISFEGGDGVGKSTQIARLEARLLAAGERVVKVREPGTTPGAERIRKLILTGAPDDWLPMSELMLMNAARHDLVERIIRPALDRGDWVLADRFADSSRAYQIAAGGLDPVVAEGVIAAAISDIEPALTLLMEFPIEEAFSRIESQGGDERRFEAKGVAFQKRAIECFAQLADQFPQRVVPLSAKGSIEVIESRIWALVCERFELAP